MRYHSTKRQELDSPTDSNNESCYLDDACFDFNDSDFYDVLRNLDRELCKESSAESVKRLYDSVSDLYYIFNWLYYVGSLTNLFLLE